MSGGGDSADLGTQQASATAVDIDAKVQGGGMARLSDPHGTVVFFGNCGLKKRSFAKKSSFGELIPKKLFWHCTSNYMCWAGET